MKIILILIILISLIGIINGEVGVSDKEILIGSSLALEGPTKELGIQTKIGMMTYINHINDKGGVNNRKIKVIFYDDGYDPVKCVENTKKLIEVDKVFALSCYVGTPTSVKAQPLWVNAKVPIVGFFTGAEALRSPFKKTNFHIRASYNTEVKAFIDKVVKELNYKKVAIFYQYDAFGEAVKSGTELALTSHNLKPIAYGTYERNTEAIEDGLNKILPSSPEVIVMVGTYKPLAKFVKEAKKKGLTKTIFYTVSFVGPEALAAALEKDYSNCIISLVVPPYTEENSKKFPVIKEYLDLLKKYNPDAKPTFVSLEGFVNAKVLVEGLKRAGSDITRDKFIEAVESIKPGQLGTGLKFDYSATDHEGIKQLFLSKFDGKNWVEITNWSEFK
ncbi:MAG TPA: ABC transporter substrate-binding protein [bacterium]|nr:ABC transporter substrate-binding protein [bacterium]HOL47749.1 ABC transporter substrate-binding protein [bacterium]HPQ17701.1 ABC transporter substrate-binding protein [bacterium]